MVRGLVRLAIVALVLVAAAAFVFGYWSRGSSIRGASAPAVTGIRTPAIDTEKARETGAEIGEKAAVATARINESIEEGSLTAKIKAKMVLDDLVKARSINVTTEGTTVILTGTVHSEQERQRAVALARETDKVTKVVDRLTIS